MKTANYLLTTTPPQQTVGIARKITPFHRFRHRLPCEKIRQKSTGKELNRETGFYYFGASALSYSNNTMSDKLIPYVIRNYAFCDYQNRIGQNTRYLDPRTSRWLSVDLVIWQGDFLPSAPNSEQARRRNANLPNGGVFNTINLHVFNYANNNPVRYVDPDWRTPKLLIPLILVLAPYAPKIWDGMKVAGKAILNLNNKENFYGYSYY
ncbi:MAG: hypothetical protein FWC91_14070 [Defluviitaleaceae bacterium]|nr:hypothetical protein [Defluviitaleaceae bacterium]